MAGFDQYRKTTQLEYGAGSQTVGPNKGVYITFIGSTADGGTIPGTTSGSAGLTFSSSLGTSFGIHGMCHGQTGSVNIPYILPIQIRSYESHNLDNQIFLLN